MYSGIIGIFHCYYRIDIPLYTSQLILLSPYIFVFWCTSLHKHICLFIMFEHLIYSICTLKSIYVYTCIYIFLNTIICS